MSKNNETLLKFPCEFDIKIFGENKPEFQLSMYSLVLQHTPDLGEAAVKQKISENGKYMALTITIRAISKAQLDAIYQDLTSHHAVLMAL